MMMVMVMMMRKTNEFDFDFDLTRLDSTRPRLPGGSNVSSLTH